MKIEQKSDSGWVSAAVTLVAIGGGVGVCHGVFYPWLIVGVDGPSIYRWFIVVSPVLLAALLIGSAIRSFHDWLVSTVVGSLVLQLYEFTVARQGLPPFAESPALGDPVEYWGRPFFGRVVGVAFLFALAAFSVEGMRNVIRLKSTQNTRE